MEIVAKREAQEIVTYALFYERQNLQGAGFGFDCDESGNLFELAPIARNSLRLILNGEIQVLPPIITKFVNRYVSPAVGKCVCGENVQLFGFTNTCNQCQRDYNMSGQELAPRSQWGLETGENINDILSIS
jgi:hypothetical protein